MRIAILCLAVLFACSKSSEQQAKEDMEKQAAAHPDPAAPPPPPPTKPAAAPVAPKVEEPPPPDPTNKADLEKAFKTAMNAQKDKDVLHYCDLMKLDDKASIQSIMGCTLSACRTKQADLAQKYVALLPKTKDGIALHDQAKKVCAASQVPVD